MWHIIDRYVYHTFEAIVLTAMIAYALNYWARRNSRAALWLSVHERTQLVIASLVVAAVMPLREVYDVLQGNQVWFKAPFDQLSWFTGAAFGAWAIYRLKKR